MKLKQKSWSAPTLQIKQRWLAGLSTWNEILDTLLATKRGANTTGNKLCDLLIYIKESSFPW